MFRHCLRPAEDGYSGQAMNRDRARVPAVTPARTSSRRRERFRRRRPRWPARVTPTAPTSSRGRRDGRPHPRARLGGDPARPGGEVAAEPEKRGQHPARHPGLRSSSSGVRSSSRSTTTPTRRCSARSIRGRSAGPPASAGARCGTVLGPLFEGVVRTGEAFWAKDHPFLLDRQGFLEETYFDVSYDPVRDRGRQRRRRLLHRQRDRPGASSASAASGPCGSSARRPPERRARRRCAGRRRPRWRWIPPIRPFSLLYLFDGAGAPARSSSASAGSSATTSPCDRPSRRPTSVRWPPLGRAAPRSWRPASSRVGRRRPPPSSVLVLPISSGDPDRGRAGRRREPVPAAGRGLPRLLRPRGRARLAPRSPTRARTRRSAAAPRRWPSSTAPRPRSSAT